MMLGIDFGTSNSAAALVDGNGRLVHIPLEDDTPSMPTALFFSSEDGRVHYGSAGLRAYLSGEEGRLMRSIKSLLGSALMGEATLVNGRPTTLFEIVVMFFRELKARSETFLGHPVHAAMLGRPVHFVDDDLSRDDLAQATLERAARAAGFETVAFQLEPIAAAFDFERSVGAETTVLVVDIGGGTSDFTVVRVRPGEPAGGDRAKDILATTGVHIGGTDFDQRLSLRHVMPLLGLGQIGPGGREVPSPIFFRLSTWHLIHQCYSRSNMHDAADLRHLYADRTLHRRLMRVLHAHDGHRILAGVEAAKIACSNAGVETPLDLGRIEHSLEAKLSPAGLGETLQDRLDTVVACARACVQAAGIGRPEAVYMTGGSSALAPLGAALKVAFPGARTVTGDRFGSVVAGLATHASRQDPALDSG
jgi:hypothetical chaperone protein